LIDHDDLCNLSEVASSGTLFNGFWLSTSSQPAGKAARGGDWCQTFAVSERVLALSIGDVCGHGNDQFAAMALLRQAIRNAALDGLDPAMTLAVANRVVCGLDPWLYATALFALLDTDSRIVTYANAGHPPPLMVGSFGTRFLTGSKPDLPLGIEPNLVPLLHVAATPRRSMLVLYTDGVTERLRRPLAGEAELRCAASFAYAHSINAAASVIGDLMNLTGSNDDDASILTAWACETPHRNAAAASPAVGISRAG
jgi:serine phosphatase RsbU (regulator of sigma subunit)